MATLKHGNGSGVGSDELLARLASLSEDFPAAIAALERQRDDIDAQLKRLRLLSRALNPSDREPAKPKGTKTISSQRVRLVAEAIATIDAETFTAVDVWEQVGRDTISDASVYVALKRLREIEYVGKAGQAEPATRGAKGRDLYRILDVDALDRLG